MPAAGQLIGHTAAPKAGPDVSMPKDGSSAWFIVIVLIGATSFG
jgi:hypothetical protein